jgi:hypothetical protein
MALADRALPAASRPRRWLLGVAATGTAAGLVTLAGAGDAHAAGRTKVKKVKKLVALHWTYDAKTKVTTVTKWRKTKVVARFVGKKVFERNAKGKWKRIPYRWDTRRKALVYDRALHLKLMPHPGGKPGSKPGTPKPSPGGPISLPAKATAASPYVGDSMVWHVARRASYGPSRALIADLTKLGPAKWLERQLAPASIPDTACDAMLARFGRPGTHTLPVGLAVRYVNQALRTGTYGGAEVTRWEQRQVAGQAHLVRALWSQRQLLTVMEDFWANHFNVSVDHDDVEQSREHYQATLRAHALGRFSDLLWAAVSHPAMLTYLNNRESEAGHPNENLGRELLELHTVGVEAGYGEAGVKTSSRILTGLSVSEDSEEFMYKDWLHATGTVSLLGFTDKNASQAGGLAVARRYLDHLARHPQTARHVCRKLAVRFVSDSPSDALVTKLAGVYLGTGTDIAAVLRTLFSHHEFAASAGAKTQRPFERLVATLRAVGYGPPPLSKDPLIDNLYTVRALHYRAGDTGNAPFAWPAPNGYPDVTGAWLSAAATLQSWNNRLGVIAGWWPGTQEDSSGKDVPPYSTMNLRGLLPDPLPATHGELVQAMAKRLFGRSLGSAHLTAVLTFLGVRSDTAVRPTSQSVGWQLPYWTALLLDSPYGLQR